MAITNIFRNIPKNLAEWDRFLRNASLSISGVKIEAFETAYRELTESYTATANDFILNCDGTFIVTLPGNIAAGKPYIVKNSGSGTITVSGTIDGGSSASVTSGNALRLRSIGSGYIEC
jgi:prophage tail gpP-like protein